MGPAPPKVPGGAWIQHGRSCAQAPHGPLHASSKLGRVCIREDNQAQAHQIRSAHAVLLKYQGQSHCPAAGSQSRARLRCNTILWRRLADNQSAPEQGRLASCARGGCYMPRRSSRPAFVQGAKRKRACPATDACDSEDDLRIKPGCAQDKSSHQPNCDIIMFDDDVRVSPAKCER